MAITLALKEETILTRDEVRELLASLPEGSIIDFSNVDFVSLSAAHEFRKIKEEKNLRFVNMNEKINLIFNMDEVIRGKKSRKKIDLEQIYLNFPNY